MNELKLIQINPLVDYTDIKTIVANGDTREHIIGAINVMSGEDYYNRCCKDLKIDVPGSYATYFDDVQWDVMEVTITTPKFVLL